jgi:hypothetical protein
MVGSHYASVPFGGDFEPNVAVAVILSPNAKGESNSAEFAGHEGKW